VFGVPLYKVWLVMEVLFSETWHSTSQTPLNKCTMGVYLCELLLFLWICEGLVIITVFVVTYVGIKLVIMVEAKNIFTV